MDKGPSKLPADKQVHVGDEIVINTRARVVDIGQTMVIVHFDELYQQGRTSAPIVMYCPRNDIRVEPLTKERLPPETKH